VIVVDPALGCCVLSFTIGLFLRSVRLQASQDPFIEDLIRLSPGTPAMTPLIPRPGHEIQFAPFSRMRAKGASEALPRRSSFKEYILVLIEVQKSREERETPQWIL
jgi:hypothetical protein